MKNHNIFLIKIVTTKKFLYYLMAFLTPVLIMSVAFSFSDIFPFGKKSLLSMDAWSQYFPMLKNMREAYVNFNPFYSFGGALGFDLWTQNAYYTNSPLWLILYILPKNQMIYGIDFIILLRFGLMGLTFFHWLKERYNRFDFGTIIFSSVYALCGYTLAFINQFMWFDAVILFPLVILGIDGFNQKNRRTLYTISLFLTLFSNFYIGFMVCVFSSIYFLIVLFLRKYSLRERLFLTFKFISCSLIAGGMAAVVLLPVWKALQNTIASSLTFHDKVEFYHSVLDVMSKLLPFGQVSLAYEAPNIYSSIICTILAVTFLFFAKTTIRRKLILFITLLLFLISMNFSVTDYIWHGFHFPNQLPSRQSFIFSFLLINMAYEGFCGICKSIREKSLMKIYFKFFTVIVLSLILVEISANTIFTLTTQTWKSNISEYIKYDNEMDEIISKYESNTFFRMEFSEKKKFNSGQEYGYNGISFYSSTMTGLGYDFFKALGMDVYAKNVSTIYKPMPILNSIFGVKYILDTNEQCKYNYDLIFKERIGEIDIYQNPYALSMGFMVDESVVNIDITQSSGIDLQNNMLNALVGSDDIIYIYNNENDNDKYLLNTEHFVKVINKLKSSEMEIYNFSNSQIKGEINCKSEGIMLFSIPYSKGLKIFVDGVKTEYFYVFDYLTAIRINEGTHKIEIKFVPEYFDLGLMVSILSFCIFLLANLVKKKRFKLIKEKQFELSKEKQYEI